MLKHRDRAIRIKPLLAAALLVLAPPASPQSRPSAHELAASIQATILDPHQCYRVRDLTLFREDIKLYFNEGYLIFSQPVSTGERLAAVFAGVEEAADGEILLVPPRQGERISLAKFTGSPNLDEHFQTAVLTFTDGSAQSLLNEIAAQGRPPVAPETAALLTRTWSPAVASLTAAVAQRMVADLLTPTRTGGGFLFAALGGNKLGNFDVLHDPLGDDQIVAGKLATRAGVSNYDVWTSFPSRSNRSKAAPPNDSPFSLDNYRIEAALDRDLALKATTRATLKIGAASTRTLVFTLARSEHVTAARIDGKAVELLEQESQRGRAPRPDENDTFLLVAPEAMPPGSTHELEIEHEGAVIVARGNGVYSVDARSTWYPRARPEFARYDLQFRYPAELTLVTPGEIVEDHTEGAWRTTRRRGSVPIRVAGFNLGRYERIKIDSPGFTVNVYGNRTLDPQLTPGPQVVIRSEPSRPGSRTAPPASVATTVQAPPPDPLGRMKAIASDVTESLRFFTTLFGPPPVKTLNVAPVPGTIGVGFPGLIYLSTLAYVDETQRPASTRDERARLFFSDLMISHEVAHQWWGNSVASATYRDAWLVEALAHYSALLWIEKKKGPQAMEAELDAMRTDLLTSSSDGGTIESFGPLVWGYRLSSAREPETSRAITYEKGAWVIHMLRQRMGDAAFFKMLTEFRRRFEFSGITTERLAALVEEFLPKTLPTGTGMPAVAASEATTNFFDTWVYGTGIPELRLKYTITGRPPNLTLTGTLDQQNVPTDYAIDVPIEVQSAAGRRQTVWVRTSNEPQAFSVHLTQAPTRVTIPSRSVLAQIK